MESRRTALAQRKAEEERAKAMEDEKRRREETDKRKRERDEQTDKRPLKLAAPSKKVCLHLLEFGLT